MSDDDKTMEQPENGWSDEQVSQATGAAINMANLMYQFARSLILPPGEAPDGAFCLASALLLASVVEEAGHAGHLRGDWKDSARASLEAAIAVVTEALPIRDTLEQVAEAKREEERKTEAENKGMS